MCPQVLTKRKRPKAWASRTDFLRLYQDVMAAADAAKSLEDALRATLEPVCRHTGWSVGHAYLRTGASSESLISSRIWYLAAPDRFEAFRRTTEETPQVAGVGLAGRVLSSAKSAWTMDVASDLGLPRSRAAIACGLRTAFAVPVLAHREAVGVVEFFSTAPGKPHDLLLEATAYVGAALGHVAERERAGRQLWETEHFASIVLASVGEGVIVYDRQLRYRVWNRFMEDLTGLPATHILGARALDIFPHLVEQGIDKILQRALAGETVRSPDTPYRIPTTGKTGWVVGLYGPLLSAEGAIAGVVAIVSDITERKLVEERQRKSEERFRGLIEHSADAIALIDAKGMVLYASPSTQRINGCAPQQLAGRNLIELIHPSDRDGTITILAELLHHPGEGATTQARMQHMDGTWRWVEGTLTNLLAEPAVGAVVLNYRDITERKEATDQLEALFKLSKQLRAASSPDEMYPILVERARYLLRADLGALALLNRSRTKFTRVHTVGIPGEEPGSTFPVSGSRSGHVVRSGMPFVTEDFSRERLPSRLDPQRYGGVGPVVIVPVRSEQESIGTLALGRPRGPGARPFTDAEIRMLEGVAEIGGTAIQRARLHQNLEEAYLQIVLALAGAVDARDTYTSDHSERIAMWAEAVARTMGCREDEVQDIRRAARLHDIGKIGIPDSILLKPMALTEAEWAVMRRHPLIGSEILMSVQRMRGVAKLVRHHQERWDGGGYPDGLMGEEIPQGARILSVVDAYSAMTDDRPYKRAQTHDEAIAELRRCAGTQFDPRVVDVFCRIVRERGAGGP